MRQLKVSKEFAGMRADLFLAKKLNFSRSSLHKLFEMDKVLLENKPLKPSYRLDNGDILSVETSFLTSKPKGIDLPVIYEDDDVIVINKPAGVLSHSKGALNNEATVASFISNKITDKKLTGTRAGIVHRLDRWTSGVIICAKTEPAQKWLQKQFSSRKVIKKYLAIVEGIPKDKKAKIDAPIARNPKKPQTFKVLSTGKPAQTQYRLVKSFQTLGRSYSLLELWPFTGRTHQLRIHLAYIGLPIIGDSVYGMNDNKNMLLHAQLLNLILPSGESRSFSTPPPSYFKEFEHNGSGNG